MEVGGITYTVDARIDGLLKFDKKIDDTTTNAVAGFNKIDSAAGKAATGITKGMESAGRSAENAGKQIDKTADATDNAGNSMKGVSGIAGQLGFQLQDIAVQAQAGTSAFVILGQQGSQIASAFGPGGAVLGAVIAVASAIGGVLFTSLKDSGTASERLEAAMKALAATATQTEGGFSILSDEIERLARVSQAAAEAQIRAALVYSQNAIKESSRAMTELIEKFSSAPDSIFDIQDALETMNRTGTTSSVLALAKGIGKDFGFAGQAATDAGYQMLTALQSISQAKDPQVISDMRDRLIAIAEGSKLSKDQIAEFVTEVNKFAGTAIDAAESMNLLTSAQKDFDGTLKTNTQTAVDARVNIDALVKAVENQAAIIGLTERGIALYTAEQLGASAADKQRINDIYDMVEAKQALIAELDKELQAELAMLNQKKQAEQKVTTEFESVQKAVTGELETPAQKAERELAERQAVIQKYGEQEKWNQDQIDSYKLLAAEATEKRITDITKQEQDQRRQMMQTTLGSIGDLFGNLADIAKEGGKDSFKAWKMMASAQAAINAALAITNVLATVPAPFNIPLAASVGALAAVNIAKIQGQQYSGRLYGGPVSPGGLYPITEDGRPEILQQGNRQYLLPGAGGRVISNRDMQKTGGGGSITINYSPTIYAQEADFEAIMASQPEAVLNAVRVGLASEGRTI